MPKTKRKGRKFEYKATNILSQEELNELGKEGWEFIAVYEGIFPSFYFKREIYPPLNN